MIDQRELFTKYFGGYNLSVASVKFIVETNPDLLRFVYDNSKSNRLRSDVFRFAVSDLIKKIKIKENKFYFNNYELNIDQYIGLIIDAIHDRYDDKLFKQMVVILYNNGYTVSRIIFEMFNSLSTITTFPSLTYDVCEAINVFENSEEFSNVIHELFKIYPVFAYNFLDTVIHERKYVDKINKDIIDIYFKRYCGDFRDIVYYLKKFIKDQNELSDYYSKLREKFLNQPHRYFGYLSKHPEIFNVNDISELRKIKNNINLDYNLDDEQKKKLIKNKSFDEILKLSLEFGIDFSEYIRNKKQFRSNYGFLSKFYYPDYITKNYITQAIDNGDYDFLTKYFDQYVLFKQGKLK